jgi:hypothetical protein
MKYPYQFNRFIFIIKPDAVLAHSYAKSSF